MRMMLKVSIPTEAGNAAFNDGRLGQAMQSTAELLKPEAAYHLAYEGQRTSLFFFDLVDATQIPAIAEPLFQGLGAKLDLYPVMNSEDLMAGIGAAMERLKSAQ